MVEEPSPIIHKFSGVISRDGQDFVSISEKNFALRGSILRNTTFVIGIVVYVGTETKAHMNSKRRKRKKSWLISKMHRLIVRVFILIAILVVALATMGVIVEQTEDLPYTYANVSKLQASRYDSLTDLASVVLSIGYGGARGGERNWKGCYVIFEPPT